MTDGSVLARIVVGIDGSEPGFEAARQAARLVEPGGWLELFGCSPREGHAHPRVRAAHTRGDRARRPGGAGQGSGARRTGRDREAGQRAADGVAPPASWKTPGRRWSSWAPMAHPGSRDRPRRCGRRAPPPRAVRGADDPRDGGAEHFPRAIVVGVDGSDRTERRRGGTRSSPTDSTAGVAPDGAGREGRRPRERTRRRYAEVVDERPVDALVEAAAEADLLVVGSRGLHGLSALGSISERVAHRAASSVLVVREPVMEAVAAPQRSSAAS